MTLTNVLEVDGVVKSFGGFKALNGVSLKVSQGEIVGLVGPNGCGKTTLVNVVSGIYSCDGGSVRLGGKDVTHLPAHKRVLFGVNRTFQVPKPFKDMTVQENIELAWNFGGRHGSLRDSVLGTTGLEDLKDRVTSTLNTAQQKRLDLARALATNPQVLFVDELGAGLNPSELSDLAEMLRGISELNVALIVVEHLMGFLEALTTRVVVLEAGKEIFEGNIKDAIRDKKVVEVFLGG